MKIEPNEIKDAITTLYEKYKESIAKEFNDNHEYDWEKREKYVEENISFVGFMKYVRFYEDKNDE